MAIILAFVTGTSPSLVAFVLICNAILVAFLFAVGFTAPSKPESRRVILIWTAGLACYCSFIALVVYSGLLERAFIPFGPLFLIVTITLAVAVGFTRLGEQIADGVPLAWLVLFQGFRLPLELVLHDWYSSRTIPETMTWTGSNWDILTGIFACLAFAFVGRRIWLAWLFNLAGIALLLNVGRVAIMSSAVPFGWQVDPPLELILYLPYAYIVPICVGGAALGHVLLTRRLMSITRVDFAGLRDVK